jgi:rhamnosyltransferase
MVLLRHYQLSFREARNSERVAGIPFTDQNGKMPQSKLVSIIIRTKNEERWIGSCLRSVSQQDYPNFEIILVDNESDDQTVKKAEQYDVKITHIEKFLPGKAINQGIRESSGQIIVCLSGHCIPVANDWLSNLVRDLEDSNVGGVYGRQEPLSFSSDYDKRDLLTVFGLDKKVQRRDPFFHNANSAFQRSLWEEVPFDEETTNIEDRIWAKEILERGYEIHYEPDASVYHYHGIHQDMNSERARSVVRILESVHGTSQPPQQQKLDDLRIVALIPARGALSQCGDLALLELPIKAALNTACIDAVWVSADTQEVADFAESLGAHAPFLRPSELSEDYIDVREVFQHLLNEVEQRSEVPDIVVTLDETYPFRPPMLLEKLIVELVDNGLDSVVAGHLEYRHLRMKKNNEFVDIGPGDMPRQLKEFDTIIDLTGLGCATRPEFVRQATLAGNKLGIYEVTEPFSNIEVRDDETRAVISPLLHSWLSTDNAP